MPVYSGNSHVEMDRQIFTRLSPGIDNPDAHFFSVACFTVSIKIVFTAPTLAAADRSNNAKPIVKKHTSREVCAYGVCACSRDERPEKNEIARMKARKSAKEGYGA